MSEVPNRRAHRSGELLVEKINDLIHQCLKAIIVTLPSNQATPKLKPSFILPIRLAKPIGIEFIENQLTTRFLEVGPNSIREPGQVLPGEMVTDQECVVTMRLISFHDQILSGSEWKFTSWLMQDDCAFGTQLHQRVD